MFIGLGVFANFIKKAKSFILRMLAREIEEKTILLTTENNENLTALKK